MSNNNFKPNQPQNQQQRPSTPNANQRPGTPNANQQKGGSTGGTAGNLNKDKHDKNR